MSILILKKGEDTIELTLKELKICVKKCNGKKNL